jgi:hypothetical protein
MKIQTKIMKLFFTFVIALLGLTTSLQAQGALDKKKQISNTKITKVTDIKKQTFKPLKPIALSYVIKKKNEESTTVPSTDCPGTTVTCTTVRADLESPIFGSSIFTVPTDLFVGNIFDVVDYTNNGTMTPKLLGTRNNITVSAYTHSTGGTQSESIVPTKTEFMAFLNRARNELDVLIGDNRPIESIEYNLENISSENQMKATLGANYKDPQNYFDFQTSASTGSTKQYVVLKFIEKSFDISMDDPMNGFFQTPTTVNSSYGFVSNVSYGRFVLLIFETERNDFNLKATLEGGMNIPGAAEAGVNASAALSTVQNKIKVRLVVQGFNANASYNSLLSSPMTLDNNILTRVNDIIGGAIGTRIAAIPIAINAKKATLENDSYPEITQKVTFNNVPVEKNCKTNFPASSTTYKYKVTFHKIYSTDDAWGSSEQLYGSLRCNMVSATKEGQEKTVYNLASISEPNQFELREKKKAYTLSNLIPGLKSYTAVFTKPECITEADFLKRSYIDVTAPLFIDRNPFGDEVFDKSKRYKRHYLNTLTTKISAYENFGNTCNASNQGIICATTPDGQNFQISYSIEKIE